ncbi:uncharacterized protein B0P05DRAFT_131001 [Gilbertella persicaria]|uniref:uncharacterized protein n=1 Tax=Gilbertella persicaria TaxID=101096 RepID=UPI00221EEC7E|nr:uncharacterized protein B0P05DRAFT_131001 [Gilbertella persicaria]KAI8077395.1 hypothetical protein B0P05DRAFT_131001 [Gilbertella persicaria]
MKVIVAETGQVFDSNSLFAKTLDPKDLNELAGEIAHRIQTREMDQILLTKNGIQLKLDTSSNKSYIQQYFEQEDSVVVFNRRLLQNPFTFQPLTIPQPTESLVEFNQILSLKDIKSMIDQQQPHLTRRLDQIHKTILKTSLYRQELIEKYIEEIHAQSIALHAALDNLESHIVIRTAHQTIDKFDRIAQREFSKHGITLASIDLDIQFLRQVELHPSLMQQQPYLTLDCYVPMDTLQEEKNLLLKTYDDLVNATLGQKNKMTHLIQQTSHMNMNRTTSEIVMDRVTKLQQEICSQWIPTLCSLKPLEQVDLLYDHEDLIYRAEMSIVDEKKMALVGFFKCMQAISQVEESVSRIYPTLAELEKRIKVFRSDLESGKGSMAKKVITGSITVGIMEKG